MSDEKKRDRALQHRVRDRQAKTGESYQAAWRHVAEAGSEAPSSPKGTRRVPLSLSVGLDGRTGRRIRMLPAQVAQITGRPQLESFWPDRLLIKNADHWSVDELFVPDWDNRKLIKHSLLEAGPRTAYDFSLDTWHPLTTREVLCGEEIALIVTYVGKNPRGGVFEATVFGWDGQPPPARSAKTSNEGVERITERAESPSVVVHTTCVLPLTVTSSVLFVDRLAITDAKDWIVNNITVRNKSIFVQSGDLPGEMFSDAARVILEPLAAGDCVEVAATYIGNNGSACLKVELSGTAEPPSEPRVVSYFLPMSTGVTPIEPLQSAQITGRPQSKFLPERLVIADPDDWVVNNIAVGTHSQLAASGDIPGQSFSSRFVDGHVSFDPVRKGQDFILVTTRAEGCREEAVFWGGAQGRLA